MMTVGILQADSVLPQFQPAHGNYPEMMAQMLAQASPEIHCRHYDVEHGQYPADIHECDGYLITGSKKSVYDDEPWIATLEQFVVKLHAARIKLVGICFGHQLIAQALGGETKPAEAGWGVGIHTSHILKQQPYMQPRLEDFGVVVSHKDQVVKLPAQAELLASNDHCPNASFQVADHILTFQGHPEFTTAYSRDLMDMRRDLLGEATYAGGVDSLDHPLHRHVIGDWIAQFFLAAATDTTGAIHDAESAGVTR